MKHPVYTESCIPNYYNNYQW